MELATWILVVMLSLTLFIFLIAGVILIVKLIQLSEEAKKIIAAGQQIASKTDDIVDNVKGMTSVGGIVKTFANRVVENQERRYREEDAARAAAEAEAKAAAKEAEEKAAEAKTAAAKAGRKASTARSKVASIRKRAGKK